jgi:hypothetical protein
MVFLFFKVGNMHERSNHLGVPTTHMIALSSLFSMGEMPGYITYPLPSDLGIT